MSKQGTYDERGPFGNPEGAHEDSSNFLTFNRIFPGFPVKRRSLDQDLDDRARIIVGKKGAGKSIYLKISKERSARRADVYLSQTMETPPATETVIQINSLFSAADREEYWTQIWRRAIISSIASHFFATSGVTKIFRDAVEQAQDETSGGSERGRAAVRDYESVRQKFFHSFADIVFHWQTPQSICNQIANTAKKAQGTRNLLTSYLNDPAWNSIEEAMAAYLEHSRPIAYYIDAIDDRFEKAPTAWVECQRGLFGAILEISRTQIFNHKIYVFCCVRDVVYTEIMNNTEHVSKFLGNPKIHLLNWDYQASNEFVRLKIENLREILTENTERSSRDGLSLLLQRDEIKNARRGIMEPIDQYILRHTRLLPRDLVNMGNALFAERIRCSGRPRPTELTDGRIRKVVSGIAKLIGQEATRTAAVHLAAAAAIVLAPAEDSQTELSRSLWLGRHFLDVIKKFIRTINIDVFSVSDLERGLETIERELKSIADGAGGRINIEPTDIVNTLWHHGLMGVRSEKGGKARDAFHFVVGSTLDADLPESATYVFHSSMIDTFGVRSNGESPVTVS